MQPGSWILLLMRLTSAFLMGTLFGGGLGAIGVSIAWDMHSASHRAEIERLLATGNRCGEDLHLCMQAKIRAVRRGK